MGLSSKKTTTNSNQTDHSVTKSDVPDWLLQPAQTLAGGVAKFSGQDPSTYAPEISGLQQGAFDDAAHLSTSPLIGQGADIARGASTTFDPGHVQGESLLTNLQDYYTPFKEQIRDPVLSDYDVNSGKVRAAQAADGAKGAFRGSRFGVREGQTEGELARGRAATEGGLLSDMFNTATSLSGQDAARRQQAAEGNASRSLTAQTAGSSAAMQKGGLLAGLGVDQGTEDRANLGARDALGGEQTNLQTQIKQFPLEYQKQLEGLFAGLDPSMFTGSTTDGTSSGTSVSKTKDPMGNISKLAMAAAMAASDRRLKRNVVKIAELANGIGIYAYRYIWSATRHIGVMAQEVLKVKPEAVFRMPNGFYAVDYGAL